MDLWLVVVTKESTTICYVLFLADTATYSWPIWLPILVRHGTTILSDKETQISLLPEGFVCFFDG